MRSVADTVRCETGSIGCRRPRICRTYASCPKYFAVISPVASPKFAVFPSDVTGCVSGTGATVGHRLPCRTVRDFRVLFCKKHFPDLPNFRHCRRNLRIVSGTYLLTYSIKMSLGLSLQLSVVAAAYYRFVEKIFPDHVPNPSSPIAPVRNLFTWSC